MNADEAASATIMANGYGETPRCTAVEIAMGAMSTAVAVFETNRPITAVSEAGERLWHREDARQRQGDDHEVERHRLPLIRAAWSAPRPLAMVAHSVA
nr:hypothetical protein [Microbacterium protaetiae]